MYDVPGVPAGLELPPLAVSEMKEEEKASGPAVGRSACLEAATALAIEPYLLSFLYDRLWLLLFFPLLLDLDFFLEEFLLLRDLGIDQEEILFFFWLF